MQSLAALQVKPARERLIARIMSMLKWSLKAGFAFAAISKNLICIALAAALSRPGDATVIYATNADTRLMKLISRFGILFVLMDLKFYKGEKNE
jgi:hypothetical protein